jgi:hypothetical protein
VLLNLLNPIVVKLGLQDQKTPQIQLLASVRLALSQWAIVEELLVAIISLLLKTRELTKVGTIMYSIISFSVWLAIINELFSQEPLYISLKPKWNKINERLRGLKDTRDRLAHHTIIYDKGMSKTTGMRSLTPARFDRRQKSQKFQPLDHDQISKFIQTVGKIIDELDILLGDMIKRETSQ